MLPASHKVNSRRYDHIGYLYDLPLLLLPLLSWSAGGSTTRRHVAMQARLPSYLIRLQAAHDALTPATSTTYTPSSRVHAVTTRVFPQSFYMPGSGHAASSEMCRHAPPRFAIAPIYVYYPPNQPLRGGRAGNTCRPI